MALKGQGRLPWLVESMFGTLVKFLAFVQNNEPIFLPCSYVLPLNRSTFIFRPVVNQLLFAPFNNPLA